MTLRSQSLLTGVVLISCELLADLARVPHVKVFKMGTREMNKYARDVKTVRDANPDVTVLTCHDEYLLPSMVQGVDGALVGFASFIPEMICELYDLVCSNDLHAAMAVQNRINPLKDAVYGAGEPTGDLDEQTAAELHVLLRRMHTAHGLTSLIATHNMRLAESCDRVLRLEHGRLRQV